MATKPVTRRATGFVVVGLLFALVGGGLVILGADLFAELVVTSPATCNPPPCTGTPWLYPPSVAFVWSVLGGTLLTGGLALLRSGLRSSSRS